MAAAVAAASLDGVVHADAVVVPRRLPRQGGSEPEILEGICGSSAGVAAAGDVPGLPRGIGGVAVDADAGELAPGPFPVTPDASSASTSSLSDADVVDFASTSSLSSLSSTEEVPVADAVIPRLTLAAVAETKTFRVDVGREPLLVEFEINGTRALAVGPTSPLAGIVRAGDVLVGVNGRAVSGASLMKVLYVEYRRRRRRRLEWRRAAPRDRYAVDAPPGSLGLTLGWANTDFASVVAVAAKSRLYGVVCVGDALQGVDGVEFSNLDSLLATLEYKAASVKRLTFARGDREPPPPRPHAVEKVYETVDVVVSAKTLSRVKLDEVKRIGGFAVVTKAPKSGGICEGDVVVAALDDKDEPVDVSSTHVIHRLRSAARKAPFVGMTAERAPITLTIRRPGAYAIAAPPGRLGLTFNFVPMKARPSVAIRVQGFRDVFTKAQDKSVRDPYTRIDCVVETVAPTSPLRGLVNAGDVPWSVNGEPVSYEAIRAVLESADDGRSPRTLVFREPRERMYEAPRDDERGLPLARAAVVAH